MKTETSWGYGGNEISVVVHFVCMLMMLVPWCHGLRVRRPKWLVDGIISLSIISAIMSTRDTSVTMRKPYKKWLLMLFGGLLNLDKKYYTNMVNIEATRTCFSQCPDNYFNYLCILYG